MTLLNRSPNYNDNDKYVGSMKIYGHLIERSMSSPLFGSTPSLKSPDYLYHTSDSVTEYAIQNVVICTSS